LSEHSEQVAVIEWAKASEGMYPQLRWLFAIPNGAKLPYSRNKSGGRFAPQAYRLIAEGLKAGVSDLFLPYPCSGYCGLWIEMKYRSNKPTQEQEEFIGSMNDSGYLAVACWSAEDAIESIKAYLNG
jgi:hypothetical protein